MKIVKRCRVEKPTKGSSIDTNAREQVQRLIGYYLELMMDNLHVHYDAAVLPVTDLKGIF